jgi:ubiquinone/menaquinone biosynthesis C-methylase UbiE
MASLSEVRENWEGFAQADPMWAICVDDEKRGRRWTQGEFFATGETEINTILGYVQSLGLSPATDAIALDFGCGVGRLTRALSRRFSKCWGVDISPTMIQLAKTYHETDPRCNFLLNEVDDLSRFPNEYFGFIYTSITLQHIPRQYVENYLLELVRVLSRGGIFVFQIPDRVKCGTWAKIENYLGVRRGVKRLLRFLWGKNLKTLRMDMNCVSEQKVRELFSRQGVDIVDVKLTNSATGGFNGGLKFLDREPDEGWVSKQYCLVKTA